MLNKGVFSDCFVEYEQKYTKYIHILKFDLLYEHVHLTNSVYNTTMFSKDYLRFSAT